MESFSHHATLRKEEGSHTTRCWLQTCTPMFIAVLFTKAKLRKNSQDAPASDKWVKKMCYLYTMEFYSAIKKNEILSFVNKWVELENIILSEVCQAQKTNNCVFSLICGL
jgi:hypothetical protein